MDIEKLGKKRFNYSGMLKTDWVIVSAANKHLESGLIVTGARHLDDIMRAQIFALTGNAHNVSANWRSNMDLISVCKDISNGWTDPKAQGFIDNYGDWLTREEAWIVAENAGQIKTRGFGGDGKILYSENLY